MKLKSDYVDNVQITLRLNRDLWEELKRIAEENGVSSGQRVICQILERVVKDDLQSDLQKA